MSRPHCRALAMPALATALLLGLGAFKAAPGGPPDCDTSFLKGRFALSGTGAFAGADLRAIESLTFDGAGRVTGQGTAVVDKPFLLVPFENRGGTYTVRSDCSGTMRWFGYHPTLTAIDHYHNADLLITDGGRRICLIYTSTEFPNTPPAPIESFTFEGQRM